VVGRSATYEYRLFSDRTNNTPLARSNPIKLTSNGVALDSGATISVSPSKLTGQIGIFIAVPVTVTWANIPDPSAEAWFVAFRTDDPLWSSNSSAGGVPGPTFVSCLGGTSVAPRAAGSCTMDMEASHIGGGPGKTVTLEFRLFSDLHNDTLLARSNPLTVSETP
jgi:hypothetical protein